MSLLQGWDNFFVILGSAAGALLGITFVVIALVSERRATSEGMGGYITPTVVHFGTVLAASCFVSMPRQSVLALSLGFGTTAVGLLIYTGVIVQNMRRFSKRYVPVAEDWIWHAMAPTVGYFALFAMALLMWRDPRAAMYGIAGALLLLLFVGIHNSWDVAVSVTVQSKKDAEKEAAKAEEKSRK
jgi:hypothetical protein